MKEEKGIQRVKGKIEQESRPTKTDFFTDLKPPEHGRFIYWGNGYPKHD